MSSPIRRLRKRKIVQWALTYGAGAWVLLQVLGLMASTYHWPDSVMRIAFGVAVIGFLVTLVLAWYHGELGEQKVSRNELLLLVALLLLGGGLLWRTAQSPPPVVATVATPTAPEIKISEKSIAVLPFVNMSSDKDQEYFSDGISEELLNQLSKVQALQVAARTSSFSFKGKQIAIPEIAKTLHVAHVLEGSVRRSGDQLRITAQLVRAADGYEIWSETWDRKLDDVFKIQDEIAVAVIEQLKVKLLGAAPKVRTTDPKAYAMYLQAVQLGRQGTAETYAKSDDLYRQVLAIDPNYAAAWVELSRNSTNETSIGVLSNEVGYAKARAAVQKALAIDPDYAPAHALLGYVADNDLAAAAKHFERALALDPADLDVLRNASLLLQNQIGRAHV